MALFQYSVPVHALRLTNEKETLTEVVRHIAVEKGYGININGASTTQLASAIEGDALDILESLSLAHRFDWFIHQNILYVDFVASSVSSVYTPENMSVSELETLLKQSVRYKYGFKIESIGDIGISISGSNRFVNNVNGLASLLDSKAYDRATDLVFSVIELKFLNVQDKSMPSASGSASSFLGAVSIVESIVNTIFEEHAVGNSNSNGDDSSDTGSTLKRNEATEDSFTISYVQETNSVVLVGTINEVTLIEEIIAEIDKPSSLMFFDIMVYDISTTYDEMTGFDSDWFGSGGIYQLMVPPYMSTTNFLQNFNLFATRGAAKVAYHTTLVSLENITSRFGRTDNRYVEVRSTETANLEQLSADNSIYVSGRMLSEDLAYLDVTYTESNLLDEQNTIPGTSDMTLSSSVYLKPEQTMVLGGFDKIITENYETSVPVLGSIPVLGYLFKNKSVAKQQVKRYISISFRNEVVW